MAKIKRTCLAGLIAALLTMAIVGTPLNGYAAGEPGCSATVSPDLIIHIPVVRYGDALYSLDLQYLGASGNLVEFSIANVQTTSQDCAVQSSITSGSYLMLNLASLILGSDNYDAALQYVSSQEINSSNVSAKMRTSYKFEIKKVSKNSDVWKGWSYCTFDVGKMFPASYVAAGCRARGRNVTLGKAVPEALAYQVLEGQLDYYCFSESTHSDGFYSTGSTGPVETTMDASSGAMSITNTYFWGEGFENMPVEDIITVYVPGMPPFVSISNRTAFAEWLYIPPNIFTRANANDYELTGKWIEIISGASERTCTWRFDYYP